MPRKPTRSARHESESDVQDAAEAEPGEPSAETSPNSGRGRVSSGEISKAEAIRRALAEGVTSPEEGTAFIKSKFGLDVNRQHFSSAKSQMRSKDSGAKADAAPARRGRKPRDASRDVEGYVAPPPRESGPGETDLLAALEQIKPLVASLGVEKVKRLADLLG